MAEQTVTVGVGALSIEDVIAVARGGAKVAISDESKHEMALSRAVIDHLADDTVPHYGISTGFGALASTSIPKEQRAQLQKSLIRSHAAGAGPEVEREVVRGLLVLRLSTLCTGRTGRHEARHAGRAAPEHPVHRTHRCAPGNRAGLRRYAERRHHPGGLRIRFTRMLR